MEKGHHTDSGIEKILSQDYQATVWRENHYLKQAFKMLLVLRVLMLMAIVAFVCLTIQLSKERDLILYLEKQINKYENHSNTVNKGAIPWFLGAAFWTTNQVFAFYSLSSSYKSFTDSAGNAAMCIWGAISMTATFIRAAAHGVSTVKVIHDQMAQNSISIGLWKQDEIITEPEAQMSELF